MSKPRHFTREELDAYERSVEKGGGHVTLNDGNSQLTYSPPPRKAHISNRIYDAVYESGGGVTRGQIAKLLGLKSTPWLRQHIDLLVADGHLTRIDGVGRNGLKQYEYWTS